MHRFRRYTTSPLYKQSRLPFPESTAKPSVPNAVVTCPYCRYTGPLLWVHGHGQCPQCKNVLEECCSGEQATPEWHE